MNVALRFSLNNQFLNKKDYGIIDKHLKKSNLPFNIRNYFSNKDLKKFYFLWLMIKKIIIIK